MCGDTLPVITFTIKGVPCPRFDVRRILFVFFFLYKCIYSSSVLELLILYSGTLKLLFHYILGISGAHSLLYVDLLTFQLCFIFQLLFFEY